MSSLSGSVPSKLLFGAVATTTGGLSRIRSYRSCSWGDISLVRQHSRGLSGNAPPPASSLSDSMPSRSYFGAVTSYYRRSLQYLILQKLCLWSSLRHAPAFQRSLWKCVPPMSSLSGSVPSRNIFGAVPTYSRRSLHYIFQKLLLRRSLPRALTPMSSLAGLSSPSYLSGRLLIVVFATRLTLMPAECVTGVVQGRQTYYSVVRRFSMQTNEWMCGMCGQQRGEKRVQISGAMRLSRSSHRKNDSAIPDQVGARRPAPPTCVDPRKLKWSPLRYSPPGRYHYPEPPDHVHQRLRCPVDVLHRAPPYRPASHGLRGGS